MLCGVCHQNEATIHLTEIINNQMMEVHLCETCAQEKGTDFKTHFSFNDLLSGLADMGSMFKSEMVETVECRSCGLTYEEFGKTGRLGCAECYQDLNKILLPLIKRVQRSTEHLGKHPSKASTETKRTIDLRELRDRLRRAVELEEFEKAAEIRDQIKKLEDKIEKGKKEK